MKTSNALSAPPCFASETEWKNWLALAYQSGAWCRLRQYPKHRALAMEFMLEGLEKLTEERKRLGQPRGDLERLIQDHKHTRDRALQQTSDISRKTFNHCIDCTLEYRTRMQAEGKCAQPTTRFVVVYSPETNDVDLEGDQLVSIGRYATEADRGPRVPGAGA